MHSYERLSISVTTAERLVAAARAAAAEARVPVSIAVVDESGVLKGFSRADGATLASVRAAQEKAYSSAATGVPTGQWYGIAQQFPAFGFGATTLGVSLVAGGAPVTVGGTLVGAVGVSGGLPDQDEQIAAAAVSALDG